MTGATTPTDETSTLTPAAVAAVEERIRPYVRRTPVIELDRADFGLPAGPLTLKLEQLQHSGSFKVRGAMVAARGRGGLRGRDPWGARPDLRS